MVSFKNGVLKISSEKENRAKTLYDIFFVINMVTIFAFYETKAIASVTGLLMFASSLFIWVGRKKSRVVIPFNTVWYTVFILYCALSGLWAVYMTSGFLKMLLKMLIILLMITSISIYIDTPEDLERIMSLFIFGATVIVMLEFASVPPSDWYDGGMGSNFSNFNANEIAFWAVCAEMMAFYKSYIKGEKWYYLLAALFLFFALLSSSRKSTAAAIVAPVMLVFLASNKKNKIINIFIIVGIGIGIFYLVMNNENLYKSVGRRFNSLSNYFSDDTVKSDSSMTMRNYFIQIGKELFSESPLFGKGMSNFAYIVDKEYGLRKVYSHNNYWQTLSELGITGFLIYYSLYALCIFRLAKNVIKHKSHLSVVFLSFMLLLLVLEYGMVTQITKTSQIVIAIAYASTYVGESDGRRYRYIENNINKLEEDENG